MNTVKRDNHLRKFNIIDRLKSFTNAFYGIIHLLRSEHNARIHILILILVLAAGFLFRISSSDWISVLLASGLVLASECFNTAVEFLADIVSPVYNEKIKIAKDVAAAGVLISATVAVFIGLIVFLPEIFSHFVT